MSDEFLTAKQIATMLSVKTTFVTTMAREGRIPVVWYGKQPLFDEDDVRLWLGDQSYCPREELEIVQPGPFKPADEPYQRANGSWTVKLECPDGVVRRFVSRDRKKTQVTHPRKNRVRGTISVHARYRTFQRDGFSCRYCGRRPPEVVLEIDHVVAVANGGGDELENLVSACQDCNLGKRDMDVTLELVPAPIGAGGPDHENR